MSFILHLICLKRRQMYKTTFSTSKKFSNLDFSQKINSVNLTAEVTKKRLFKKLIYIYIYNELIFK